MSEKEILEIFTKTDALLEGHFLLTSGKHSNRYFQCAKVLQYPDYTRKIVAELTEYFREYKIDTVIAPAMGGIIVGYEVARALNKRFIFTEREEKEMKLRRGFEIFEGERFLVCEDVITTGGSVREVIDIVLQNGGEVAGVGTIVDRSNGKVQFGFPQKAVLKMQVEVYEPDACPLCKANLPLVKPGSRKVFRK
jgi:orotate phosphoribosyltransferase